MQSIFQFCSTLQLDSYNNMANHSASLLLASKESSVFSLTANNLINKFNVALESKFKVFKGQLPEVVSHFPKNDISLKELAIYVEKAMEMEMASNKYMTFTCMRIKEYNLTMCKQQAEKHCKELNSTASFTSTGYTWLGEVCSAENTFEAVCSTTLHAKQARHACGLSTMKARIPLGVFINLYLSRSSVATLLQAFELNVSDIIDTPMRHRSGDWMLHAQEDKKFGWNVILFMLPHIFYVSIILCCFLNLIVVLTMCSSGKYISKYLTDRTFDNAYYGVHLNVIDAKRWVENRETLLPLKSMERSRASRFSRSYSMSHIQKFILPLGGALIGGALLLCCFFADWFMYEIMAFLVDLSGGYYAAKLTEEDEEIPAGNTYINGDGAIYQIVNLVKNLIFTIFHAHSDYTTSRCTPFLFSTNEAYWYDFIYSWILVGIVIIMTPLLSYSRHVVADFFYTHRVRARAITLYNSLLLERRRHMNACRNRIVYMVFHGQLQEDAQQLMQKSHPICNWFPWLRRFSLFRRVYCIICRDRVNPRTTPVFICPRDGVSTCVACLRIYFRGEEVCITCLDRKPRKLFRYNRLAMDLEDVLGKQIQYG